MHNLQEIDDYRRSIDPAPELSAFDPLTGVASRQLFQRRLDETWESRQYSHRPMGLLLMDFDHFRTLREHLDKEALHEVLARCGRVVSELCQRRADLAGRMRYGEMGMLLAELDLAGARLVADRLRTAIEELAIPLPDGGVLTVTIGGICMNPNPHHFARSVLISADQNLKEGKEAGRNCAVIENCL